MLIVKMKSISTLNKRNTKEAVFADIVPSRRTARFWRFTGCA
jgi:hypothetical protein